jgi:predicted deacylase
MLTKGRVIIIPVVNMHGFQFRTPWMNVKDTGTCACSVVSAPPVPHS